MQILATSAWALVLICTANLFSHGANAQAGSVGGTVAKREKSVSGGENTTERRRVRTAISAAENRNCSAGFTAATISGSWQYETSCNGSRGQGSLSIVATSATGFAGAYYGSGKILQAEIPLVAEYRSVLTSLLIGIGLGPFLDRESRYGCKVHLLARPLVPLAEKETADLLPREVSCYFALRIFNPASRRTYRRSAHPVTSIHLAAPKRSAPSAQTDATISARLAVLAAVRKRLVLGLADSPAP